MSTLLIKPGRLLTINNCVYRSKKRVNGCHGCDLNSFDMCPCIVDRRRGEPRYDCATYEIILKRL